MTTRNRLADTDMVVALAYYTPAQYELLRRFADDPSTLCRTHTEYEQGFNETFSYLRARVASHVEVVKVDVSVTQLVEWCRHYGMPVDFHSGAAFACIILEARRHGH